MQRVTVVTHLLRVEVEPALAPHRCRPAVPGDIEGLQATPGQGQQQLLQGLDPEYIAHRKVGHATVFSGGVHDKVLTLPAEGGGHAAVREAGVVEVTQHAVGCRRLHREVVVRALPGLIGVAVTAPTAVAPDIAGMCWA